MGMGMGMGMGRETTRGQNSSAEQNILDGANHSASKN
jgi:hypothetical protein